MWNSPESHLGRAIVPESKQLKKGDSRPTFITRKPAHRGMTRIHTYTNAHLLPEHRYPLQEDIRLL